MLKNYFIKFSEILSQRNDFFFSFQMTLSNFFGHKLDLFGEPYFENLQ